MRDALKAMGFGLLTEINMRATLRGNLGEDMEDYLILGACDPSLAHLACRHRLFYRPAAAVPAGLNAGRGGDRRSSCDLWRCLAGCRASGCRGSQRGGNRADAPAIA